MKKENFEFDITEKLNTVASATECTGLIQIPPTNEEEAESYGDIYVVPEQVNDFAKVKRAKGRHVKSAP
ncbi:MAG: hypothetical protein PUE13_03585 [Clostridiales bacterium]|nr:hypothetical protein [Clostridiales bacterium]